MAGSVCRLAWRQLPRRHALPPLPRWSPPQLAQQQRLFFSFAGTRSFGSSSSRGLQLQTRRSYSGGSPPPPPPPPPPPKSNSIKFWPFLVLIGLGSYAYVFLVQRRAQAAAAPTDDKTDNSNNNTNNRNSNTTTMPTLPAQLAAPARDKDKPAFSPEQATVVFVLGGPGAGKGTQCERLVAEYGFAHLSAGDLLRAEQDRPGSQFGAVIKDCIRNGAIVPMEVTVQLLENAMAERLSAGGRSRFLIDGFPRKMDQALKFEQAVCPARLVLFFDCPEREMERRLLERGKTSGRADDNEESIRKRFRTFVETSMPVVDHYEKEGRVLRIDATPTPDAVYSETRKRLAEKLAGDL